MGPRWVPKSPGRSETARRAADSRGVKRRAFGALDDVFDISGDRTKPRKRLDLGS
jgi:hypothetical protein